MFGVFRRRRGWTGERPAGACGRIRGPAADDQPDELQQWFVAHGIPQFLRTYPAANRLYVLVVPLAALTTFELASLRSPHHAAELFGVPLLLAGLTVAVRPWLPGGRRRGQTHGRVTTAVLLLSLTPLLGAYILGPSGLVWSEAWFSLLAAFLSLLSCLLLASPQVWSTTDGTLGRRQRRLVGSVLGAGPLIVLDGLGVLRGVGDRVLPYVPRSFPSFAVVAVVFTLSVLMFRGANRAAQPTSRPRWSPRLVPPLVLALGLAPTVLPAVPKAAPSQVLPPLLGLALVLVVSAVADRLQPDRLTAPAEESGWLARPGVVLPCLALYLLCYPVLVTAFIEVDLLGRTLDGLPAGAVVLAIHLLYLAAVWATVRFDLDLVGRWAATAVRDNVDDIARGMAHGLPLLLIFAVFFQLTAETWQVVVEVGHGRFLGLVAVLLALAMASLGLTVRDELSRQLDLAYASVVGVEVTGRRLKEAVGAATARPQARVGTSLAAPPVPRLRGRALFRSALILVLYLALVFVPVTLGAAGLFCLVGWLAVSGPVAAQWVYGDGWTSDEADALVALPLLDDPWLRVPLVLTAFSLLHLTVTVLSSRQQRDQFFAAAREKLAGPLRIWVEFELDVARTQGTCACCRRADDVPMPPAATVWRPAVRPG
jgi:hypothetical protein